MRFKRNEPYRYVFETPLYCMVYILHDKVDGSILDLSPNGMKIRTHKDLPLFKDIYITFGLNGRQFNVTGEVRWKKNYVHFCIGGVQLKNDPSISKMITNELKEYVKNVSRPVIKL